MSGEQRRDGSSERTTAAELGPVVAEASPRPLRVKIASTAFYAPSRVETAAELAPRIGTSEEWIVTRTSVRERRISEEPVEVMGARAATAVATGRT